MTAMRDLVVLGGGAAGVGAALQARADGLDVVLVEPRVRSFRDQALVALADELAVRPLRRAPLDRRPEGFRFAVRRAGEQGSAFIDQRDQLLSRRGVSRLIGRARLTGEPGLVLVAADDTTEELRARHVLLASGARPIPLRSPEGSFEGDEATGILDDERPPATACVIGGGRHGAMLAGLLAATGAETWLVESAERLLQRADADVSAAVQRALEHAGVVLTTGTRVTDVEGAAGARVVRGVPGAPAFERVFVTAGRTPDLSAFGPGVAEAVHLPLPPQRYETDWPWLFVAGAATGRPVTAEAARREGRAVASRIRGRIVHVPHGDVPSLVGGPGACGWAGLTEDEAAARGLSLVIGRARLPGRGALAPGFVKVVADRGSRRLLGVHVVGHGREAVALGGALVELGVSVAELGAMCFPPGTGAEALAEAAAAAVAP